MRNEPSTLSTCLLNMHFNAVLRQSFIANVVPADIRHLRDGEGTVFTGVCLPTGEYPWSLVPGPFFGLWFQVISGGIPQVPFLVFGPTSLSHINGPVRGGVVPNLVQGYPRGQDRGTLPPSLYRTRMVVWPGQYAACVYAGGLSYFMYNFPLHVITEEFSHEYSVLSASQFGSHIYNLRNCFGIYTQVGN